MRFSLASIISASALLPSALALWPIPQSQNLGNSTVWITSDVKFSVNYVSQKRLFAKSSRSRPHLENRERHDHEAAERIQTAINTALNQLFNDNFYPWKLRPRDSEFTPDYERSTAITISTVEISIAGGDPIVKSYATTPIDESYTLKVAKTQGQDASVKISAVTSVGVLRGLTTLTQLFYSDGSGRVYSPYLPVDITDSPKFSHRGLNLDVARSYYPVADIKRTLDALSWNKMNRLHMHVTDSQSWPLVIPSMPELSAKGAYRPDYVYTPNDIYDIQKYGAMRGIIVIFEIDMPGHFSSAGLSHPDLITAFNVQPDWSTYCAEPPCGQLKLNSPAVDTFITNLFSDLLPRLSNSGAVWFHSGGDEVNANAYLLDETVKSNQSSVITPYLQRFVTHAHSLIIKNGLVPIAWEEMLLDWGLTLDKSVIVQAWTSSDNTAKVAAKGHRVIGGDYTKWYLDCGHGQWLDFRPESFATFYPFADYCSPLKNWRLVYSYSPDDGVPDDLKHLVIGGEVHMWSESTDPTILDARLWPRVSAAAEVLWSGNKEANGQNRTQLSVSPRLSEMRERMVARGISSSLVHMTWCTQNEGDCAL